VAEATKISHPEVTNNTGKVERVVDSTIASTTTLQAGTTILTAIFQYKDEGQKTLNERTKEADEDVSTNKVATNDGIISELNQLYEFKGDSVKSFLEENPSLGGLLFGVQEVIREYFGSEVEIALEVMADPEALGDKQLFVLIRTELPRKVARRHLAELDQGWWLNTLPAAEGKIEIALE
jgi:hypothetical protein